VKLLYFAWVRERIGMGEEEVDLPDSVATVGDLIAWLSARGPGFAHAFERPDVIRAALDRRHVPHDTALADAREAAFFPPMTGG
jgi:molybdopterin synthase sulfur carrier subunit